MIYFLLIYGVVEAMMSIHTFLMISPIILEISVKDIAAYILERVEF